MAILGTGDIAKVITDRKRFIFFAKGCSNRIPLTNESKQRELYDIICQDKNLMFVYFSTLSIYYSDSEYTKHKLRMEKLVMANFNNYCIIRIGNITWGDNPNTLINFFKNKIKNNGPFEIKDTFRYLIDEYELNHWISLIPEKGKHEMNITGRRYSVKEIVNDLKENL